MENWTLKMTHEKMLENNNYEGIKSPARTRYTTEKNDIKEKAQPKLVINQIDMSYEQNDIFGSANKLKEKNIFDTNEMFEDRNNFLNINQFNSVTQPDKAFKIDDQNLKSPKSHLVQSPTKSRNSNCNTPMGSKSANSLEDNFIIEEDYMDNLSCIKTPSNIQETSKLKSFINPKFIEQDNIHITEESDENDDGSFNKKSIKKPVRKISSKIEVPNNSFYDMKKSDMDDQKSHISRKSNLTTITNDLNEGYEQHFKVQHHVKKQVKRNLYSINQYKSSKAANSKNNASYEMQIVAYVQKFIVK